MPLRRLFAAMIVACGALISGESEAAKQIKTALMPISTTIEPLKGATPPIGWTDFCARYANECAVEATPAADIELDARSWKLLNGINDAVNEEIEPITDIEQWGVVERWDFPTNGKGDCEEFVLEKRRRLISAGLPRQALLVTVVRDKKGDGHAVLIAKTNRGDFVLDNQDASIKPWATTGYGFIKRQSQENPNVWVALGEPKPGVVAVGNPR